MSPDAWSSVRRLLVARLDNIGDVVLLSPALRTLRHALPQAHITLMASPAGSQAAPLLPWIDDVIIWRSLWQDVSGHLPFNPARELGLVNALRSRRFDGAVIFTSFSQSPYPPAYVAYLAGIPLRLGHSREFGGGVLSHWYKPPPDEGHQAERNLALLAQAGFSPQGNHLELQVPAVTQAQADGLLREVGIDSQAPFIVLAPGASCAARRYDPVRFATVTRMLAEQSGLPVIIAGSQRESETLQPVLAVAGETEGVFSLVGRTNVPELAGIIRRASLVVANNSASLHLAEAFECPMVILYSGTEHVSQWLPRRAPARVLRQETDCSPCFQFNCPFGMECLDISPQEVVAACLSLLAMPAMPATSSLVQVESAGI